MPQNPDWPVIVHQLSSSTDLGRTLRQQNFKVRVSESIIPGSVIFPVSGVAFMVVPLSQATSTNPDTRQLQLTTELTDRLDKFHQTHRDCYCMCQAPLHGQTERNIFSLIQKRYRYMFTRLRLLPVHNTSEAVSAMVNISKALCKPVKEVLRARLDRILSEHENRDFISAALKHLGLNSHQIHLLEDSIGSLAKLSTSTQQTLLDCSLDTQTVSRVLAFFSGEEE